MKSKILIFSILGIFFFGTYLQAQSTWNWPDDKKTAEVKNALYTDNFRQGNYREAANHLSWLLNNAPNLHNSIYINGVKIYSSMAANEKDQGKKIVFQDSVLLLYDMRIKFFDNESKVLNRKAYDAYRYYSKDKSRYEELFNLYKNTFELNGNKVMNSNLLPYMDVVRRYKLAGGKITDDEVLDIYAEITQIIIFKIETVGKNIGKLKVIQDKVNELLVGTIDVDCDFVENKLGPKLKADPENLKLAKNILRLSFAGKCMSLDVSLEAAKVVQKNNPEYALAKMIAQLCAAKKNFACAQNYYEEAIDLTDENTKKADAFYSLATIMASNGKKVTARNYAKKALDADPTKKEAYKLIGDLYYNSYNDCKKGVNPVQDRAIYLAAYEMYRKAGDGAAMNRAKQQFPTMEDIFTWNLKVGAKMKVGCWINETVTVQKR